MKRKTRKILTAILGVLVAVASLTGIVALVNHLKAEDDGLYKLNLSYQIGGLDETGKYEEIKGSIYTKKAINLNSGDELQFTVDFDNDIEYQLFFYDGNDEFVSSSEVLRKNHKYVAESDTNVRVLITPVWDEEIEEEDREINLFTIGKYSTQLTIEVKRYEEGEPEILTFTVSYHDQEYTYNFEDGMTWAEFIVSDYNTDNVFEIVSDPYVFYQGAGPTNNIVKTDLINSETVYQF